MDENNPYPPSPSQTTLVTPVPNPVNPVPAQAYTPQPEPLAPVIPPTPAPQSAGGNVLNYASFGRRWAAQFLDSFIIGIVSGVISFGFTFVAMLVSGSASEQSLGSTIASLVGNLLIFIITVFYFVYFVGNKGQTLGKMALGIKVVTVDTMVPPGYTKAFLRETIGRFLSAFLALGYLWVLWDAKKQTWHDKIAGTIVIRLT